VAPVLSRAPLFLIHHGSYEGYRDRADVFSWWQRTKARVAYDLSARRADVVCTVSEFSKRDMVKFYGIPAERIHVVPEGVDTTLFRPMDDAAALSAWRQQIFGADLPFLLYVGKPTKRRNLPNLLQAFARLRHEHALPHKLLLIGTALPGTSFEHVISNLGLAESVVTVPHARHAEIALAYNACSVMLYPSSYEGFGMPVLEAMACGAPVIALDNTAFPEFAGGVARLLPDAEVDTLMAGIRHLLDDAPARATMRVEGPRRAARYDWQRVAQAYLDLLVPLAQRS
jgi:glycosyltransferase involved in cell wall biosynthesis